MSQSIQRANDWVLGVDFKLLFGKIWRPLGVHISHHPSESSRFMVNNDGRRVNKSG